VRKVAYIHGAGGYVAEDESCLREDDRPVLSSREFAGQESEDSEGERDSQSKPVWSGGVLERGPCVVVVAEPVPSFMLH
jgi:hypothetical protein